MEVKDNNPAWLDESHPNYLRWKLARELSIERGKFVRAIINQQLQTKNLAIFDLGSGEGGTSTVFSQDNFVVSLDLSLIRLNRQKELVISSESSSEKSSTNTKNRFLSSFEMTEPNLVNSSALQIPFANSSFDVIIIQDVIEHVNGSNSFLIEIKRVLKPNGMIYLSTPNKYSLFNFISDPHFGLPFVSILKRESIKKYFLKYFRKGDYNRKDIAQLFSLDEMLNLFQNDFEFKLYTKFSVQELFNGNKGIVWSAFHLNLISFCKFLKLDMLIKKIANDKKGIINRYFTPTFYIILKRLT